MASQRDLMFTTLDAVNLWQILYSSANSNRFSSTY